MIKLNYDGVEEEVMVGSFPGGERQVKLSERFMDCLDYDLIVVKANITSPLQMMDLILICNAIYYSVATVGKFVLELPYFPYARQDRVCAPGEAFSLQVMCNILDRLNFDAIKTLDVHSGVARKLLNTPLIEYSWIDVLRPQLSLYTAIQNGDYTLVSPDAGARPKMSALTTAMGVDSYIKASKIRDIKTGHLSGFSYKGDVKGKDLLIMDDICDGGGTFIGLAKKLYEGGAKSVNLYVSHGIFSKGLEPLLWSGIEDIYTTDSVYNLGDMPNVQVLKY